MGAIIRQQFKDPTDGIVKIRDMHIDAEIICPDGSIDGTSSVYIKIEPALHPDPRNPQNQIKFEPVSILCPPDLYCQLLDGKRSCNPPGCHRTRIMKQSGSNNEIIVIDNNNQNGLYARVGDPLVLLSDIDSDDPQCKHFALVKSINNNTITLYSDLPIPKFLNGAIVENLKTQWHKNLHVVGAKSQLKRPHAPTFNAFRNEHNIEILISVPLNLTNTQYYDIYVRDHSFFDVSLHWMPDINDLEITSEAIYINTYNGGPEAGGGTVGNGVYYVTVIAKDGKGKFNVNESPCVIKII